MSDTLLQEYAKSQYFVLREPSFEDLGNIYCDLQVGELSEPLDRLLRVGEEWALITAWNPQSMPYSLVENRMRNRRLLRTIKNETTFDVMYAFGCSSNYDPQRKRDEQFESIWLEESFLLLGFSMNMAIHLASSWNQKAILMGQYQEKVQLISVD